MLIYAPISVAGGFVWPRKGAETKITEVTITSNQKLIEGKSMIIFDSVTSRQRVIRCLQQAIVIAVLLPAVILLAVPTTIAQDGSGDTGEPLWVDKHFLLRVREHAIDGRRNGIR